MELTKEQKKLINYIAKGYSVREISETTGVNNRTLEDRLIRIRKKISAKNNCHLVYLVTKENKFS